MIPEEAVQELRAMSGQLIPRGIPLFLEIAELIEDQQRRLEGRDGKNGTNGTDGTEGLKGRVEQLVGSLAKVRGERDEAVREWECQRRATREVQARWREELEKRMTLEGAVEELKLQVLELGKEQKTI